jgi:hypothetical protein
MLIIFLYRYMECSVLYKIDSYDYLCMSFMGDIVTDDLDISLGNMSTGKEYERKQGR